MERQHYFRNMLIDILRKIVLKSEILCSHKGVDKIQGFWNAKPIRLFNRYLNCVGPRCSQKVKIELLDLEEEGRAKW
jgi:hypothetical protein